jgi:hypothetical protein
LIVAAESLNLLVWKSRQLTRLRDFYAAIGIDFVEEKHGDGPTHFAGRIGGLVPEDGRGAVRRGVMDV